MINCDRDCSNCIQAECMVDEQLEKFQKNKEKRSRHKTPIKYIRIVEFQDHEDDLKIPNSYYYDY